WTAYVLSALRHLRDRPVRVSLAADSAPRQRLRASAVIVGNVSWLQGGIRLLPDAEPDDGILDAVVLSARGWSGRRRLAPRGVAGLAPASRAGAAAPRGTRPADLAAVPAADHRCRP